MDRLATFTWHPRADRWTWDAGMYRLFGYAPDSVLPGRALLVAHCHPGDRERLREALVAAALLGQAFACRHRIVADDGNRRDVIMLGGTDTRSTHRPVVRGHVVDLSHPLHRRPDGHPGSGATDDEVASKVHA